MNNGSWKQNEIDFLTENIGKLTLAEMATTLGKTELAVKLYMHRHRMNIGPVVKRNLLQELLRMKFGNPKFFQPTREFYAEIGITQRRFWDLFHGRKQITDAEYLQFAKYFNVSLEEAFEARQLNLFQE
ncbi:XRE family transcriptional regulator [Bacteroides caecigallinarum]|uniref:XRE family transcriptional regulator n=1 Tax=Bacteroides caecigallinarum TaxID=1411144 RepID=UPI00195D3C4A|nr:XRE family transcriptional regulator [Bacteroides caecigallinarum]MBM6865864.1 XRE family transcriptional regulator [Bacteroides caecigallinarum]